MKHNKEAKRGPVFKGERLTPAEKRLLRAASSKVVSGNRDEKKRKGFKAKPSKLESGGSGTRTAAALKRIRAKVRRLSAVARQDVETRPNARPKTSGAKPRGVSHAAKVKFDKADQKRKLKEHL